MFGNNLAEDERVGYLTLYSYAKAYVFDCVLMSVLHVAID